MKKPKQYKPKSHTGTKKFAPPKKSRNTREFYDSEWDAYRFRFLHHNPNCYVCGCKARIVDHIVAHKGDLVKFKAINNHMPLCEFHHNVITGKFDRVNPPLSKEKILWINKQRETLNVNIVIKALPEYGKGYGKSRRKSKK